MAENYKFSISDGIPMSLKQMQEHLQSHHGVPVALRKEGTAAVRCPCCRSLHEHGPGSGHYVAGCNEDIRCSIYVSIGDRSFVPNFGYDIYEHKEGNNVNELLVP